MAHRKFQSSPRKAAQRPRPASSGRADSLRLSQCMIVKNEEENIERALSWAKDIAFEQIVVDTGSTDRTVELAKKMGAKVVHFEWIDDFSAAKNYAIEQASGNWIAFLDADEYLAKADASKLVSLLSQLERDSMLRGQCIVLSFPLANVDENGKPVSIYKQERVFRNMPQVRYTGKIHERLSVSAENVVFVDKMTIIHTGYTKAQQNRGKAGRNIQLLQAELKERPDDPELKAYLAESYMFEGGNDNIAKAEELFAGILSAEKRAHPTHRKRAYTFFISKFSAAPETLTDFEASCRMALKEFPDDPDFEYYLALSLNKKGDYISAWPHLKNCEQSLLDSRKSSASLDIAANPIKLFLQMVIASQALGDVQGVVKYATMSLSADKSRTDILSPYIATLLSGGVSESEILNLLGKIYDYSNPQDLLAIANAAKDCGALELARLILEMNL